MEEEINVLNNLKGGRNEGFFEESRFMFKTNEDMMDPLNLSNINPNRFSVREGYIEQIKSLRREGEKQLEEISKIESQKKQMRIDLNLLQQEN